jgi:2-amino-4-hydroxy-6-hydroxymethyldihydropteridine diphosphokinase
MVTDAYIGLGSNLGDRAGSLRAALDAIDRLDGTRVIAVSSMVESEPWGVTEQAPFANAVARVATELRADRLLDALKDIEAALGRGGGPRYGPRVIDLDILLFGDEEWQTDTLAIPHPRMAERDFVITPLLELAPEVTWPDGSRITRENATEGRVTGSLGLIPGYEDITPPVGGWVTGGTVQGGAWERVSSAQFGAQRGMIFAAELMFDAAVLEQDGIPIAWDPMPPTEEYSPWSLPRRYHLLVPAAFADRARRVLLEAHAAEPLPGGEADPGGGPDIDQEGGDDA